MFEELRKSAFVRAFSRGLLAFDAWMNSSLFESSQKARRAYDDFAAYMDRFHVAGGKRLMVEFACEGLTLGLGGAMLMLGLALPAFREVSDHATGPCRVAVALLYHVL